MTIYQVFMWFCKMNRIMDEIIRIYFCRSFGKYLFNIETCVYEYHHIELNEYLEDIATEEYSMFPLFTSYTQFYTKHNQKLTEAASKWRYFIKNNVIHINPPKISDNVTYQSRNGTITKINDMKILVKFDDGKVLCISLFDKDLLIDGERRQPLFKIRRKNKIYGVD